MRVNADFHSACLAANVRGDAIVRGYCWGTGAFPELRDVARSHDLSSIRTDCGPSPTGAMTNPPPGHDDLTVELGPDARRAAIFADASEEVRSVIDELAEALAPRFQLVRRLGAGGMGIVFLARDPLLKRLVAIKVLTPDLTNEPSERARFVREAQSAASVAHPNIVAIHLVGELPRSKAPFFVMQYVEGTTLGADFPRHGPVSETDAVRILGEAAFALATAHGRGVVHRDIKPSNIMIEAGSDRVIVVDFGISTPVAGLRETDTRLTAPGIYIGTPRYMSPEQASHGELSARTDVYSLGCVAFELLTGRPPFDAPDPISLLAAHLKDPVPDIRKLRPDLSPRFARLVTRCLAKLPDERPSSDEIRRALAPPAARLAWPPRIALPMRNTVHSAMRWLNIATGLLAVPYVALLFVTMPERVRSLLESPIVSRAILLGSCVAGIVAAWQLAAAFLRILALRRLGFSSSPMLDIVSDHDGRTGDLILGLRRFAGLTHEQQKVLATARTWRATSKALVVPTIAAASLIATFVVRANRSSPWLGTLIVGLAAGAWVWLFARCVLIERRLLGGSGSARERGARRSEQDNQLHQQWLRRYWVAWRVSARAERPSRVVIAERGLVVVTVALALVAGLSLFFLQTVAEFARDEWQRVQQATPDFSTAGADQRRILAFRAFSAPNDTSISLDEANSAFVDLVNYGRKPSPGHRQSSVTADPAWRWLVTERRTVRQLFPSAEGDAAEAILRQSFQGFNADQSRFVTRAASYPTRRQFSTTARAPQLDLLGATIEPSSPDVAPGNDPDFEPTRDAAYQHIVLAAAFVARHQRDSAEQALREIVSFGMKVIDNGRSTTHEFRGRKLLLMGRGALATFYERARAGVLPTGIASSDWDPLFVTTMWRPERGHSGDTLAMYVGMMRDERISPGVKWGTLPLVRLRTCTSVQAMVSAQDKLGDSVFAVARTVLLTPLARRTDHQLMVKMDSMLVQSPLSERRPVTRAEKFVFAIGRFLARRLRSPAIATCTAFAASATPTDTATPRSP